MHNGSESSMPDLSVVVPFYNEEACVAGLLDEIHAVMRGLGHSYEIVTVDDGSSDATPAILSAQAEADSRVRVLGWKRNQGQAAALFHGLQAARAPLIVTMDGDGQNDPADIPALLSRLGDGDMIVGIRQARHDSWLRRWMSRLANAFRGRVLKDRTSDSGCALKVFRREVVAAFVPMLTLYSFMPALAVGAGFRVDQHVVRHRARQGGISSYGLRKMLIYPLVDLVGVYWFNSRRFILRNPDSAERRDRAS